MTIHFKLIYNPFLNRIFRNLAKPLAKFLNLNLFLSVSGTVNLKYNKIRFKLKTNPTSWVTQILFFKGPASYEFTPMFAHLAETSEVFFDVGANIGYFTILGEKINPNLISYAFEPSRGALKYLYKNITTNNLKNAVVIGKAISDQEGTLTFYEVFNTKYPWIDDQLSGSHSLQNEFGIEKKRSYTVQTTSLNRIVEVYGIQRIDLLKLDTECTEHQILAAGKSVIKKFRPIIISEVYEVIQEKVEEVLKEMTAYKLYHYKNNSLIHFNKFNDITDKQNRNFIFCPEEKLHLLMNPTKENF
jgi:FkbM family methyltransferase